MAGSDNSSVASIASMDSMSAEALDEFYRGELVTPTSNGAAHSLVRVRYMKDLFHDMGGLSFFQRVIDVGCHCGHATRWMLDYGVNVLGIDPGEDSIENAIWAAECLNLPCRTWDYRIQTFRETDEDLDPSVTFDLFVCFELIEHLHDKEVNDLIQMAVRRTRRGGHVLFSTPDIDGPFGKDNPDPRHINLVDLQQIRALFACRGFDMHYDTSHELVIIHGVKQ